MKRKQEISEYEMELNKEIVNRVTRMEQDDYDFGEKFSKGNYIAAVAISFVSLLLLIIGAYL